MTVKLGKPLLLVTTMILTAVWVQPFDHQAPKPHPLGLTDVLAWKTTSSPTLSNDGQWFAYRLSPTEGDSEVIIRQTNGDRELVFPAGASANGAEIVFADDSRWVAFTVTPDKREAEQAKKQTKPAPNRVSLVELATGKETTFEKMQRFAFSGESASHIALHKSPLSNGNGGSVGDEKDRPRGSDLVLRDLLTGSELNIGNVSEFAFDRPGRYLAWVIDAQDKSGNGIAILDLKSGVVRPLENDKASYSKLTWTEKGDAFAVLKCREDKAYKDPRFSLVAFDLSQKPVPDKIVYDPQTDKHFPDGMTISPDRAPTWNENLSTVFFGIREAKKVADKKDDKKAGDKSVDTANPNGDLPKESDADKREVDKPEPEDKPDLVVWHWLDKRLQTQQQVDEEQDKRFNYFSAYRIKEGKFIRLADDEVREVTVNLRGRFSVGRDEREYQRMGSMDGRLFFDAYTIDCETGMRKLAVKKVRHFFGISPDGSRFLYHDDGHFYVFDHASGKTTCLTKAIPTSFIDDRNDQNIAKPPVTPIGWAKDNVNVVLSDGWDIWKVDTSTLKFVNLTGDGKRNQIRYRRRFVLDRDEKGIDLENPVYFEIYGEWTKMGGIACINPTQISAKRLLWTNANFSRLLKAKSAATFVYSKEDCKTPPDFYSSDAAFTKSAKLTKLDAQLAAFTWSSGAMLIDFTSDHGDHLQATLMLPANYDKGKRYPTIVVIYERMSQEANRFGTPSANGFNKSLYTSNGYAVLLPDIKYRINDPGRSAVSCVLPALNAAIARGIVDKSKVGLHGHSWGGYQTAYLVTQTDAFAAAVAGAPLTNLISMYSLLYKNTGGTNQAIFESAQGRFIGSYADNWDAFVRNSPVAFARNVTSPLLILHNDKDGAVDFTQGVEFFNILRRLGKRVVMLEYLGENHGLRKPANMRDYTVRMGEFFAHYLKGTSAPDWMEKGVDRLDMEEHLKPRIDEIKKAKEQAIKHSAQTKKEDDKMNAKKTGVDKQEEKQN